MTSSCGPTAAIRSPQRRHDRSRGGVGSAGRRRLEGRRLGLGAAAPDPAGHRDDGARPVDEQAGRRGLGPPALDDPEAHAPPPVLGRREPELEGLERGEVAQPDERRPRPPAGPRPARLLAAPAWSATSSRAASGASPMSSDSAGSTPSARAPAPTASQTRQIGVTSKSSRFIETWAQSGSLETEAARLDAGQAAARLADGPGDPAGRARGRSSEVDVPGDEERPRPDGHRPGGRVEPGRPEVGRRSGSVAIAVPEPLVLAAPDVGQLLAVRARGRPGVQVDGDPEPLGDPGAEVPGQPDAVVDRRLAERHERDDVDRPDPRVLPGLVAPCRSPRPPRRRSPRARRRRPPRRRPASARSGCGSRRSSGRGGARRASAATAAASRSTTSARRPSLKFGTDSTSRPTGLS